MRSASGTGRSRCANWRGRTMDEPFTRLAHRVGKDDGLTATARLLFAALDSHLCKRSGRCDPSIDRLAGWIGCSARHVKNLLRDLERAGYVRIDRSAGRRNSYVLLPHSNGHTGEPGFTPTGEPGFTGLPFMNEELREKEHAPPPDRAICSRRTTATGSPGPCGTGWRRSPGPRTSARGSRSWPRTSSYRSPGTDRPTRKPRPRGVSGWPRSRRPRRKRPTRSRGPRGRTISILPAAGCSPGPITCPGSFGES